MSLLPDPAALDECAREPIHIPGAIQPFGALVAMSLPGFVVTHASANCADYLAAPSEWFEIGAELRQILPRQFMHDLGNTLQAASIARIPERMLGARLHDGGVAFDVIAHVTADGAVCEFVRVDDADDKPVDAGNLLRAMMARLSRAPSIGRLLALAAQQVRAVTGYDRVMIYKFREDASGIVVAESLRTNLDPYIGLHYPASDIPPQARELFRRQPLRQIPDVYYTPSPVIPEGPGDPPLDLSLSHLRSASPIHLEYLRNMGSAATLTISILRGDTLWGLIACHHQTPRRLSSRTCGALELFAQLFSLRLEAREQASELEEVARAHAVVNRLRDASAERPVGRAIETIRRELVEILPHDGAALWIGGEAETFGSTPPVERLPELVRHIHTAAPDGIYASNRLSAELPDALRYTTEASGVLAMPLSRARDDFLLLFRREEVQTLAWGGDPSKPMQPSNGGRIGPRQSFAAWKEVVRGASLQWTNGELRIAEALQLRVIEFMLSHARVVDENRRATAESQSLLIAELGHRVKNIFALIRSVVRQSRGSAASLEDYASDIERRIGALAVAHDQVTHVGWRPASLRRLLEEQARTWSSSAGDRITLDGPAVLLDVRAVQAFALVLHEMMTNAAKYGALSQAGGSISIAWTMKSDDLHIAWRESGGPPVEPSDRKGFGSIVIAQTIPFELTGTTDVRFPRSGVEADFVIPSDYVTRAAREDEDVRTLPTPVVADLSGKKILLVEDSMMIALDAQSALEAIGASVDIVASVADGLRAIELTTFSMAVLDINLRGETSAPLADALSQRDVPFIFASGYGDKAHIPERFRAIPKVSKPYDAIAISDAIATARARLQPR